MPYVTSIERHGREDGLAIGLRDTVQAVLEVRFGGIDAAVIAELQGGTDLDVLQAARNAVKTCSSVDELRAIWLQTRGGK